MDQDMLIRIAVFMTVTLWKHVMSQCSEAHNVACSMSLMQLERYDVMNPVSGYMPDYNQSTLTELCSTFQEYMNCSRPFLRTCNQDIIHQLNTLESAFIPICTDFTEEYILHRVCYRNHANAYANCQKQRNDRLTVINVNESDIQYKTDTCNLTNQYLQCVYVATSLGCSLQAANVYFNILNQTISIMMRNSDFICNIRHPKDVIQVFTTTTSTTTEKQTTTYSMTSPVTVKKPHPTGPTSKSNHIISVFPLVLFLTLFCVIETLELNLEYIFL